MSFLLVSKLPERSDRTQHNTLGGEGALSVLPYTQPVDDLKD